MPADDDEASGPPPHPLDRVWFHPSELGSPGHRTPAAAGRAAGLGRRRARPGHRHPRDPRRRQRRRHVHRQRHPHESTRAHRSPHAVDPTRRDARADHRPQHRRDLRRPRRRRRAPSWPVGRRRSATARSSPPRTSSTEPGSALGRSPSAARSRTTTVLGVDPETDLALLKVDGVELAPAQLATGGDAAHRARRSPRWPPARAAGRGSSAGVISDFNQFVTFPSGVRGSSMILTDTSAESAADGGRRPPRHRHGRRRRHPHRPRRRPCRSTSPATSPPSSRPPARPSTAGSAWWATRRSTGRAAASASAPSSRGARRPRRSTSWAPGRARRRRDHGRRRHRRRQRGRPRGGAAAPAARRTPSSSP